MANKRRYWNLSTKIYLLLIISVLLSGCIIEPVELQTKYTKLKTSCDVTSYQYDYKNNFLGTDTQTFPASYRPYKDEVWSKGWMVGKEEKMSPSETYDFVKLTSPDDMDFTIIDSATIEYNSESNLTLNYSLRRDFPQGYRISKINCVSTRY
ncbi:MAG: hypothetical protein FIB08_17825 [Candidatus Methanoperedens sp.]|nr:hypothetical protein [Candidatus Methanoperedens sp.]